MKFDVNKYYAYVEEGEPAIFLVKRINNREVYGNWMRAPSEYFSDDAFILYTDGHVVEYCRTAKEKEIKHLQMCMAVDKYIDI